MGKLGSQFSGKLPRSQPPPPVSAVLARSIHAGLAAQADHILHREQGELGRRCLRRPDERPVNFIVTAAEISFRVAAFMLGASRVEPAYCRVIVMRSRVNNFAGSAMRQIHVRALIAK